MYNDNDGDRAFSDASEAFERASEDFDIEVHRVDVGIGRYEYHGVRGVDTRYEFETDSDGIVELEWLDLVEDVIPSRVTAEVWVDVAVKSQRHQDEVFDETVEVKVDIIGKLAKATFHVHPDGRRSVEATYDWTAEV